MAGGADGSPYRDGATVAPPDRGTRYAPMTRRAARLRRGVRALPVVLFALVAFLLERPWLLGVAIAWGIGVIVVTRLSARSLNARLKALAGTLARDGDPFVAARALEAIVADSRGYPGFHSIALLFLGIARARSGDADGALELLYLVQRGGWLAHRAVWLAWLLPWMSQLHAARGDVDQAEQWLRAARDQLPPERQDALVSAEAILGLRLRRDEEVIKSIDAYAGVAEASDPVREHYALLRAFACERAGRPMPQDEVRRLVALRRAAPGRALPLEKWWVDFAAFLERHAPDAGDVAGNLR